MSSDTLFSWSPLETAESWYVSDVCICGVKQVIGSLSDGVSATVVSVDINSGKKTAEWKQIPTAVVSLGAFATSPVLFAFDKEGSIWQLDIRSNGTHPTSSSALSCRRPGDVAHAGAISSDGHSLAVAMTMANETTKKKNKKSNAVGDQASSSDDESVEPLTYSVQLWDVRNIVSPLHSYSRSHSDDVQAVSFSFDQPSLLISGGADGLVNIFDSRIPNEDDALQFTCQVHTVKELEEHKDLIRCARYDVNQRLIVTGADDCRICGSELLPPVVDVFVAKGKPKDKLRRRKPYVR
ncbi:WD repeat-containing protein 89 [Toxocara canis]|uniref:WD repeat-containing protein 89 n=1 Tax=Toxocara canis TaxID=6265 RepID=A0A0B2UQ05_TOXCA|nr:WD repeat-containing protein 89 [Toxocara canis]